MTAKEHYDRHLANFYSWMVGDFDSKQQEQQQFFEKKSIASSGKKTAIDLGCGHGLQSVSLARLGFHVYAVDFSEQLLDELNERKGAFPINTYEEDLLQFISGFNEVANVIVCMGDTLTHLESKQAVGSLIQHSAQKLVRGGKLILSFRDMSTELQQEQRFFLVKSEANRIHTCFLEYFPAHVHVYDILSRFENGTWKQTVSWYPKLRLKQSQVEMVLKANNLKIVSTEILNKMIHLVAEKS